MARFRAALTKLAALKAAGIQNNYDLEALPDRLHSAQLPALLILPIKLHDKGLFREPFDSLGASAFSGGLNMVTYTLTHLLLAAPRDSGLGMRSHLPQLVTLTDSYIDALADDVTLGGALRLPAEVAVEPGVYDYGEREFYGCAFRHRWTLEAGA